MQLISEFLEVYFFPPRLNNLEGANNQQDFWVLDCIPPWSFPPIWEEECSSLSKLLKLLDGKKASFE
jgi:hypothetical protein